MQFYHFQWRAHLSRARSLLTTHRGDGEEEKCNPLLEFSSIISLSCVALVRVMQMHFVPISFASLSSCMYKSAHYSTLLQPYQNSFHLIKLFDFKILIVGLHFANEIHSVLSRFHKLDNLYWNVFSFWFSLASLIRCCLFCVKIKISSFFSLHAPMQNACDMNWNGIMYLVTFGWIKFERIEVYGAQIIAWKYHTMVYIRFFCDEKLQLP